ncbi:hypothetical protein HPB47_000582 [Ixodes persulcatus]|uniref:Uncharacterized protein n=1 Tax=Ixodes persulcatus TaxID=34615 RepID=A0AC60PRB3_IXOPE|nr:hypothetical protein HPB47_000582 [Ixodes persulcatus]
MAEHPEITLGAADIAPTVTQVDKDKLWAELVAELNAIGPAFKDRRRWQHYCTDSVGAAKKKADEFRKNSGPEPAGQQFPPPSPPRCPRAERHSVDIEAEALIRGQQRQVELAVARLAALEQQTSAIRQLTLVLLLLVLMTSATRQPCLPLPCRPPTPPPLD